MKYFVLVLALVTQSVGYGFVPPLTEVLKKAFSGRRWMPSETQFKHRVKLDGAREVLIDEKLAEFDGQTYHLFSWNSELVGATSASSGYLFGGGKKIFSSSRAFNSYFTIINPDKFRDILVSEGFSKRSQWEQYPNSFVPEGNPAFWDLATNYMIAPDVSFSRSESGISILVEGFDNGSNSKSVSFDKESFLLSEINWKNSNRLQRWWFRGLRKISRMGSFPTEMGFVVEGNQLVSSRLIQRRYLNSREKRAWLQKFKSASLTKDLSEVEGALKILLGHR